MILRYTPLARQDLHEIEDYIKNDRESSSCKEHCSTDIKGLL